MDLIEVAEYRGFLPRSEAAYLQLRANCIRDGIIHDPVMYDAATRHIVDGYQRRDIHKETGVPFASPPVAVLGLKDQLACLEWIYHNDRGRRQMTAADHYEVLERLMALRTAAGRENCRLGGKAKKGFSKLGKAPVRTDKEIASLLSTSTGTIHKLKYVRTHGDSGTWELLKRKPKLLDATWGLLREKKRTEQINGQIEVLNARGFSQPSGHDWLGIQCGDVLDGLRTIPDGAIDVTMTSVPYPLKTVHYDRPLRFKNYREWLDWMAAYLREQYRVTSTEGGRLAINIDEVNETFGDTPELVYAAADDTRRLALDAGFKYRGRFIWFKRNANGDKPLHGQWQNPWVQRTSEPILLFHKGSSTMVRDPALRDVSDEEMHYASIGTWHINPETRDLVGHPAPYPVRLVNRLVKWLCPYRDTVVLDPFNGVGTTTFVAQRTGRRFVGIDQSREYCAYARWRVSTENDESVPERIDDDRQGPPQNRKRMRTLGDDATLVQLRRGHLPDPTSDKLPLGAVQPTPFNEVAQAS